MVDVGLEVVGAAELGNSSSSSSLISTSVAEARDGVGEPSDGIDERKRSSVD